MTYCIPNFYSFSLACYWSIFSHSSTIQRCQCNVRHIAFSRAKTDSLDPTPPLVQLILSKFDQQWFWIWLLRHSAASPTPSLLLYTVVGHEDKNNGSGCILMHTLDFSGRMSPGLQKLHPGDAHAESNRPLSSISTS